MKTQPQAGKGVRISEIPGETVRKRKSVWHNLGKFKVLYLMFLPGVLFLLVNNYMPMFGVLIAFKNVNYADGIWGSPWSGWDNFKYLFSTSDAWEITRNTIAYNTVFIALNLFVGVGLAILLNEVKNKAMSKLYQSLMLLPYFLSMIVVSYLVLAFLGKDSGFMNSTILPMFGGNRSTGIPSRSIGLIFCHW